MYPPPILRLRLRRTPRLYGSLAVSRQIPAEYDTGINRGLSVPDWFYHFAFDAGSVEELYAKRSELIAKGVKVTPIVDHDWILSIYFKDPNGLLLEYAAQTRAPRRPPGERGPTHYGYLAPTLPYHRFPRFLVLGRI